MYHRVCPARDSRSLEPLNPRGFEKQMEYFCRSYEPLSLDQLAQYICQGKTFPEKAVVITFDDGYKDNYLYAYPVLKKYRIPATIFLTTGHIGTGNLLWPDKVRYIIQHTTLAEVNLGAFGNHSLKSERDKARAGFLIVEKMKKLPEDKKIQLIEQLVTECGVDIPAALGERYILSWEEVMEMSNNGIDFGAHSVTHPILTQVPLEQAKWEIMQSKKDIEERLGKQVTAFAYPNGDYNSKLAGFVKECGFTCAVSVLPCKLISSKDNPYELSRIPAMEDSSKMKVMLSGLWGDLQGILSGRRK